MFLYNYLYDHLLYWFLIASICVLQCFSIVFVCFSEALSKEKEYFWSEGNIPSPLRYSYLSIFPNDNTDIFAAYLLILFWNFSSLILLSIVMISFYILSQIFWLKLKDLSDARVSLITNNNMVLYGFAVHFL